MFHGTTQLAQLLERIGRQDFFATNARRISFLWFARRHVSGLWNQVGTSSSRRARFGHRGRQTRAGGDRWVSARDGECWASGHDPSCRWLVQLHKVSWALSRQGRVVCGSATGEPVANRQRRSKRDPVADAVGAADHRAGPRIRNATLSSEKCRGTNRRNQTIGQPYLAD